MIWYLAINERIYIEIFINLLNNVIQVAVAFNSNKKYSQRWEDTTKAVKELQQKGILDSSDFYLDSR
jgi:hypothetical protein